LVFGGKINCFGEEVDLKKNVLVLSAGAGVVELILIRKGRISETRQLLTEKKYNENSKSTYVIQVYRIYLHN
jgi:hypothetical protein